MILFRVTINLLMTGWLCFKRGSGQFCGQQCYGNLEYLYQTQIKIIKIYFNNKILLIMTESDIPYYLSYSN